MRGSPRKSRIHTEKIQGIKNSKTHEQSRGNKLNMRLKKKKKKERTKKGCIPVARSRSSQFPNWLAASTCTENRQKYNARGKTEKASKLETSIMKEKNRSKKKNAENVERTIEARSIER